MKREWFRILKLFRFYCFGIERGATQVSRKGEEEKVYNRLEWWSTI